MTSTIVAMVAEVAGTVSKTRLSIRELKFCREFAVNGGNAAQAYRVAYRYKGPHADGISAEVMARPHIRAHFDALAASLRTEGQMDMRERRQFLARVVRDKRRFAAPDAGTRIRALSEDAILAGERRTDGTQVTIGGDLNLSVVLQSLRGGLTAPQPMTQAMREESAQVSVEPVNIESRITVANPPALHRAASDQVEAPNGAILGPLRGGLTQAQPVIHVSPAGTGDAPAGLAVTRADSPEQVSISGSAEERSDEKADARPAGAILGPLGWVRPRDHGKTAAAPNQGATAIAAVGRCTSAVVGNAPFAADD